MKPHRMRMTHDLLLKYDLLGQMEVRPRAVASSVQPEPFCATPALHSTRVVWSLPLAARRVAARVLQPCVAARVPPVPPGNCQDP